MNLICSYVSVFRWYLCTILVLQSLIIFILHVFDESFMIIKIKERGEELFKFKSHGHVSNQSIWIECNKYVLHIDNYESRYQFIYV